MNPWDNDPIVKPSAPGGAMPWDNDPIVGKGPAPPSAGPSSAAPSGPPPAAGAADTPAPHSLSLWDATKHVIGGQLQGLKEQFTLPHDVMTGQKQLSDPQTMDTAQGLGLSIASGMKPMGRGAAPLPEENSAGVYVLGKKVGGEAPKPNSEPWAADPVVKPADSQPTMNSKETPASIEPKSDSLQASEPWAADPVVKPAGPAGREAQPPSEPANINQPPAQAEPRPQSASAAATPTADILQAIREENKTTDPTFKDKLAGVGQSIKAIISPESMEGGEAAVTGIRKALGRGEQQAQQGKAALQKFSSQIDRLPDADKLGLMDYLQSRSAREAQGFQPLPEWKPFLDTFRNQMLKVRNKMEAMPEFENAQFQQDYLSQMYKDPGAARKFFNQSGKMGSKNFLKGKKYASYDDAIRQGGLEPLTLNPIELGVRYLDNAHRFIEMHDFMQDAKEAGDWELHPPGYEPPGWVEMKSYPRNPATNQRAYAPEGFATIYDRFKSQRVQGRPGQVLDALRSTSNTLAGAKFALSAYHFTKTAKEAIEGDISNAVDNLMTGHPIEAAKSAARAPLTPIKGALKGRRLQNAYKDADSQILKDKPQTRKAMDALVDANFRFVGKGRAADEYRFSQAGSYFDAFKRGALKTELLADAKDLKGNPIARTVPVIAKQVGRIMETMSQPLFEVYIPAVKTNAAMDMMETFLKNNPTASDAETATYARKVSDIIDNRFGEMNQDNIFWHNTLKQVAQLGTVSWSYEFGTARSVLGAAKDAATAPMRAIKGQQVWTPQMSYPIAAAITNGSLAAIAQYLHTGKGPESARDLVAPQTGGIDASTKKPEREVLPGDEQTVMTFFEHPGESLKDKQAFWLQMLEQLSSGTDWRGDEISKSTDSNMQKAQAYAKFIGQQSLPIYASQPRKKGSALSEAERFMGNRPANMMLTDPKGYDNMMKYLGIKADRLKIRHDARQKAQQQ